jgi:hypothetical protein
MAIDSELDRSPAAAVVDDDVVVAVDDVGAVAADDDACVTGGGVGAPSRMRGDRSAEHRTDVPAQLRS